MTKLSKTLGLGVADTTIEKWEKNISKPTEPYRSQIIKFLGIDPGARPQARTAISATYTERHDQTKEPTEVQKWTSALSLANVNRHQVRIQ